jgi:hypothetical protein
LIWGTHDRMIPAHHASAALATHPSAKLALIDGAGHLPHRTRTKLVTDRLTSFVNDSAAHPRAMARDVEAAGVSHQQPIQSAAASGAGAK